MIRTLMATALEATQVPTTIKGTMLIEGDDRTEVHSKMGTTYTHYNIVAKQMYIYVRKEEEKKKRKRKGSIIKHIMVIICFLEWNSISGSTVWNLRWNYIVESPSDFTFFFFTFLFPSVWPRVFLDLDKR